MKMRSLVILFVGMVTVNADIYFHNPRGSNNRLSENSRPRANANRLFDSQNNDRGGYNVGRLYYIAGSKLMLEWTNQHSCGSPNANCEIVIQYMCGDQVRDGLVARTIRESEEAAVDRKYGRHESYEDWLRCKLRARNTGLFTADQNLRGRTRARFTRQNPGGGRRGYECPEERDYYPYWHPTAWKDLAVMTNDPSRCDYYRRESQNVKERHECVIPRDLMYNQHFNRSLEIPNTEAGCQAWRWPVGDSSGAQASWTRVPSHGLPAPECTQSGFSRDNHQGNTFGGQLLNFNWTVPDVTSENCVLRIRYNISTSDYPPWETDSASNKPRRGRDSADLDLSGQLGFTDRGEAEGRGYVYKNDPAVAVFPQVARQVKWRLAINTAQYGRTFQDRTHTFAIRPREPPYDNGVIHNVNVRGKRGNIVQAYPAVEYDFTPNTLEAVEGEFIHFQWTGSDRNPFNNDGQGRRGSDRSNLVLLASAAYSEGNGAFYQGSTKLGHWGRSYPAHINETTFLGMNQVDLRKLAFLTTEPYYDQNLEELDDAGAYFDMGPRRMQSPSISHYMCTRNNQFTNRNQKGRIILHPRT